MHAGCCSLFGTCVVLRAFCTLPSERYGSREVQIPLRYHDVPLPLRQAPPRAKRRTRLRILWESVCDKAKRRNRVFFPYPRRVCQISACKRGYKRREKQQRRGGVSRVWPKWGWYFCGWQQPVSLLIQHSLHVTLSCSFGNSLTNGNTTFIWNRGHSDWVASSSVFVVNTQVS